MYSPYGHYLRPYFKSISTSDSHSGAGWKASDSHSVSFDPNNYTVGIDPNSYDVSLLRGGQGKRATIFDSCGHNALSLTSHNFNPQIKH